MSNHMLPSGEALTVTHYQPPERKPNTCSTTTGLPQCSGSTFNNLYVKNFPVDGFEDSDLHVI